jgi:rhodanese-related sulfurtransferase
MALNALDLVAAAKQNIKEIDIAQAESELQNYLILDVREPAEYSAGCLPKAINIPRGVLEFKIDKHPDFQNQQDTPILVYCLSGGRSALATEALQKLGYTGVVSMAGGFTAWQQAGFEITNP